MPRRGLVGFRDLLPPPDGPADPVKSEVAQTLRTLRESAELRSTTAALREVLVPPDAGDQVGPLTVVRETTSMYSQLTHDLGDQLKQMTERVSADDQKAWEAYDRGYDHAHKLVQVLREVLEKQYETATVNLTETAKASLEKVTKAYEDYIRALQAERDRLREEVDRARTAPPSLEAELGKQVLQPMLDRFQGLVAETVAQVGARPTAAEDPEQRLQREWMDLQLDFLGAKVRKAMRDLEREEAPVLSREDVAGLANRAVSLAERLYDRWSQARAGASGLSAEPPPEPRAPTPAAAPSAEAPASPNLEVWTAEDGGA
jgi:flagellar biosynthesis/type III secretory pathway protein FliH